ncbi:MAG: [acyl-carrier-protein] S-malonyltransferase [Candidatus Syntrophonatronum acetioxidans]|uniref:Malonyl CoA-acyl carrier protein transacylase n=1 Tax=Candidatus Syntrophonatronum acetioxidans TaxID=1795816 RepID=A0A424YCI5_9FIRM|nr:MAG: [acyl-carrier-protein] S-malonyltransferase [Candidatus Syntrophonatronum acetioxidans]
MRKVAFLFSGQGAQYPGMGQDFFEEFEAAREVFRAADDVLGFDLTSLVFKGTKEDLKKTEITQPAVMTTSLAIFMVLREEFQLVPQGAAGLSLGEYTALTAAGVFELKDSIRLVQKRARLMQEGVPQGKGCMAAILGLSKDKVEEACREAKSWGLVSPANYNCPGQIVIAGEKEAVEEAVKLSKEKGAKRTAILPMSVPSHCALLKSAGDKLGEILSGISTGEFSFPVVSNVKAEYYKTGEEVKELLSSQLSQPVLWEESIRLLIKDGFNLFVEVGPGNTLTGFMKKIDRNVSCYPVGDKSSLEKVIKELEG